MRMWFKLIGLLFMGVFSSVAGASAPVLEVWGSLNAVRTSYTQLLPDSITGPYTVTLNSSFLDQAMKGNVVYYVFNSDGIVNSKNWFSSTMPGMNSFDFRANTQSHYGLGVKSSDNSSGIPKVTQHQFYQNASQQFFNQAPKVQFHLTVAPMVPEADTWLGMILGVGAIAIVTYRKKTTWQEQTA